MDVVINGERRAITPGVTLLELLNELELCACSARAEHDRDLVIGEQPQRLAVRDAGVCAVLQQCAVGVSKHDDLPMGIT